MEELAQLPDDLRRTVVQINIVRYDTRISIFVKQPTKLIINEKVIDSACCSDNGKHINLRAGDEFAHVQKTG